MWNSSCCDPPLFRESFMLTWRASFAPLSNCLTSWSCMTSPPWPHVMTPGSKAASCFMLLRSKCRNAAFRVFVKVERTPSVNRWQTTEVTLCFYFEKGSKTTCFFQISCFWPVQIYEPFCYVSQSLDRVWDRERPRDRTDLTQTQSGARQKPLIWHLALSHLLTWRGNIFWAVLQPAARGAGCKGTRTWVLEPGVGGTGSVNSLMVFNVDISCWLDIRHICVSAALQPPPSFTTTGSPWRTAWPDLIQLFNCSNSLSNSPRQKKTSNQLLMGPSCTRGHVVGVIISGFKEKVLVLSTRTFELLDSCWILRLPLTDGF